MSANPCDRMEAAWDPARREAARQARETTKDTQRPTQAGRGTRKDTRCQ